MNERIKKLRKALDMTQQEFAEKIGVKRNSVAQYETGRNEPTPAVILLMCKEFGVNETWLRTGEGEMFAPSPSAALDALAAEYKLTRGDYVLIEKYLNLKESARAEVLDYITEVAAALSAEEEAPEAPELPEDLDALSIDEKVALYRAELEREEKAEGKSEA